MAGNNGKWREFKGFEADLSAEFKFGNFCAGSFPNEVRFGKVFVLFQV